LTSFADPLCVDRRRELADIQATLSTVAELAIALVGFRRLVIALAADGHEPATSRPPL
jgi:hypothetical protein